MTSLFVLGVSIAIAFFLGRGLEPYRPEGLREIGPAMIAAVASPFLVVVVAQLAADDGSSAARFGGFAFGVILIGYAVLAGTWALRLLADAVAQYR